MKKCAMKKCEEEADIMCECTEEGIFLCNSHVTRHLVKSANKEIHSLRPVFVTLKKKERKDARTNANDFLSDLHSIKFQAIVISSRLISTIEISLANFLSKIRKKEKQLQTFLVKLEATKNVSAEIMDELNQNSRYSPSFTKRIEEIIDEIQDIYEYKSDNSCLDCEEALLFQDNGSKIIAINLESFTQKTLDFSPNLDAYCAVCRVSLNQYFINGGVYSAFKGETYLLDLEQKSYETLPSASPRAFAASAYKDKVVYIFGGSNLSGVLATCEAFDIERKKFSSIAHLPKASHYNSAAVFNKMIYLSGLHMNSVLSFDGNSYQQVLPVSPNEYKVVCSGWILVDHKLYQMNNENFSQWPFYANDFKVICLNSSCTFKRKNFIYFIHNDAILVRINLNTKAVETVHYS